MRKTVLISLLLAPIFFYTYGQGNIDSLEGRLKQNISLEEKSRVLHKLAFVLADYNPDTAVIIGKQAVQLSLQIKDDTNYEASLNSLGWAYYRKEIYDTAESLFKTAIVISKKIKDKSAEGRAIINLVTIFETQKQFEKALTYAMTATKLFEEVKDAEPKAYCEKQIGIIYREMNQYEKAKTYLVAAMADFLKDGDTVYYMTTLPSYAGVYVMQHKFDSALIFYRPTLVWELQKKDINLAFAFENMGETYFDRGQEHANTKDMDSALYYFQRAKTVFEEKGGISDVAYEEKNIAKALIGVKRYAEAIEYLKRSLSVFEKNKDLQFEFEVTTSLADAYSEASNFEQAYKYAQERNTFKDSLDAENNKEKIANMFAQYETDKKDRTIQLLNTQQKLDQQQISRQHILAILMVSLGLFGAFTGLILWNRRGIKQKLKEVEMRNQISSDLHDDIGSSLSSILLLSNLASQKKDDENLQRNLLDKISNNAKEVIDRMSDIVWTMNPKFDEGESLRERIENYLIRLREITDTNITGDIDKKIDQYHFSMELRKNIFLIIKEATNNALKYADATLLALTLTTRDKYFELAIKDNGIGFNKDETPNGNGFETMIARARASGGDCSISSEVGKGTEVKALIPIPHIR